MALEHRRLMHSIPATTAGAGQFPGISLGAENSAILDAMRGQAGSTDQEDAFEPLGPIVQLMSNTAGTGNRQGQSGGQSATGGQLRGSQPGR